MKVYTPRQTAEILQISEETILNLSRSGEFPAQKVGGQWRILEDALKAYFDMSRIKEYLNLVEKVKELDEYIPDENSMNKIYSYIADLKSIVEGEYPEPDEEEMNNIAGYVVDLKTIEQSPEPDDEDFEKVAVYVSDLKTIEEHASVVPSDEEMEKVANSTSVSRP